jgi:hypothetical protein
LADAKGEQVVERLGIVAPGVRGRERVEHHISEQRLGRREGGRLPFPAFRRWRRQNELVGHAAILPTTTDIVVAHISLQVVDFTGDNQHSKSDRGLMPIGRYWVKSGNVFAAIDLDC